MKFKLCHFGRIYVDKGLESIGISIPAVFAVKRVGIFATEARRYRGFNYSLAKNAKIFTSGCGAEHRSSCPIGVI